MIRQPHCLSAVTSNHRSCALQGEGHQSPAAACGSVTHALRLHENSEARYMEIACRALLATLSSCSMAFRTCVAPWTWRKHRCPCSDGDVGRILTSTTTPWSRTDATSTTLPPMLMLVMLLSLSPSFALLRLNALFLSSELREKRGFLLRGGTGGGVLVWLAKVEQQAKFSRELER